MSFFRFDQSKEGYLEFMNYFIDDEKRAMREFLQNISVSEWFVVKLSFKPHTSLQTYNPGQKLCGQ